MKECTTYNRIFRTMTFYVFHDEDKKRISDMNLAEKMSIKLSLKIIFKRKTKILRIDLKNLLIYCLQND